MGILDEHGQPGDVKVSGLNRYLPVWYLIHRPQVYLLYRLNKAYLTWTAMKTDKKKAVCKNTRWIVSLIFFKSNNTREIFYLDIL